MRPILALAILLVGLKIGAPGPNHEDAVSASDRTSVASVSVPVAAEQSVGKADRTTVLSVPAAVSSDAAHDQGEQAAGSSQSLAATSNADADVEANADVDFEEDIADSLDGLCNALFTSARNNDLPVPFFANLIWQESRFRHNAVSPVGALGIAQFMPRVAAAVGLADPFDPRQAIPASARLLHELREQFSNLGFVAAAYNAGARRVSEWLERRGVLPRETRVYVLRVTGRPIEQWQKAPPDDFALTFVRPMPCRELPAFADLEQAQLQQAQSQRALPQQAQIVQKREAVALGARRLFGVRRKFARRARLEVVRIIVRFRANRREATGHRLPHERRRVARGNRVIEAAIEMLSFAPAKVAA